MHDVLFAVGGWIFGIAALVLFCSVSFLYVGFIGDLSARKGEPAADDPGPMGIFYWRRRKADLRVALKWSLIACVCGASVSALASSLG